MRGISSGQGTYHSSIIVGKLLEKLSSEFGLGTKELAALAGIKTEAIVRGWQNGTNPAGENHMIRFRFVEKLTVSLVGYLGPALYKPGHVSVFFSTPQDKLGKLTPTEFIVKFGDAFEDFLLFAARKFVVDVKRGLVNIPDKPKAKPLKGDALREQRYFITLAMIQELEEYFSLNEIGDFIKVTGDSIIQVKANHGELTNLQLHQLKQAAHMAKKLRFVYRRASQIRGIMRDCSQSPSQQPLEILKSIAGQDSSKRSQKRTERYLDQVLAKLAGERLMAV